MAAIWGVIYGTTIGAINWDTRRLDYSSCECVLLRLCVVNHVPFNGTGHASCNVQADHPRANWLANVDRSMLLSKYGHMLKAWSFSAVEVYR